MKPFRQTRRAFALATSLCLSAFGASAHPWSYDEVAAFHPAQGSGLYSAVTRGADGLLYGTAASGGANGVGSVYRIEADNSITVLHPFAADGSEGNFPLAGLLLASDGWFYGGTAGGTGPNGGNGTIFKISPAGEFVQLHVFSGFDRGPTYTLAQDAAGNIYGNVIDFNRDAIFKMTPDNQVTIVHRFTGHADGGNPSGPLLVGPDGTTLYGLATTGPGMPCGELFALAPDGSVSVVHAFEHPPAGVDGCVPSGTLAMGRDHRLYGMTFGDGFTAPDPQGEVFSISLQGDFAVTHVFSNDDPLGMRPNGGLSVDSDGILYGTTKVGGAHGTGTVFSLSPKGQVRKVLHAFQNLTATDGSYPYATPTALPDGTLAGTTSTGGKGVSGTVYKLTPAN